MIRAVDFFAGAGGWTTGAVAAGVRVEAAVNHWPRAVETHAANHPDTLHVCQDAGLVNVTALPGFEMGIFSPECTGHSPAAGKSRPEHEVSRATAWCVTRTAELCRPKFLLVENVVQFRDWILYPRWIECLRDLGYAISENVLNAADFGVPQERVRLFVVGVHRARRAPLITPPMRALHRPVAAREILDFDAGSWSPINRPGRSPKTLQRIEAGRREHGRRFLICYYGSGSGNIGRSLNRPIGTITTKDRWAIVDGDRMRMISVEECRRAMGFPDGYVLTGDHEEQVKQLGNAVCPPVAREVVRQVLEAA